MNKTAFGVFLSVVIAGNLVTIMLLLGEGGSRSLGDAGTSAGENADLGSLLEAVDALRNDVGRLSARLGERAPGPTATDTGATSSAPADGELAVRFDEVVERLGRLEETIASMRDVEAELAVAELREKRAAEFRGEEGYQLADELLAEKQFAVGANGILTFLDAHPDHPDARDLMKKARDAFFQGGYREKALWLHEEIMKKYPEHRGQDLYSLALLERKLRRWDDAIRHMDESVELATTDQSRMNRLFYRAYLIHQRDGDARGLAAYREVERAANAAGIREPADEAGKRAGESEARLASR